MSVVPASLTAVARHLLFIRETLGPNRGYWVEWLQRQFGGIPGDSWCAYFVSLVLEIAYMGDPPLHGTGSTKTLLAQATTKGYRLPEGTPPQPEDLYFFVSLPEGIPHHVGIVTGVNPLTGIAGNTSPDGKSANGTGVFEHALHETPNLVLVRLPR